MATDTEPPRLTITDPKVMRALAHPARLAIVEHLMSGATGTATELAAVCGLSPSATSYHLRALARFGLVEEAPGRGDARERVWRSSARGLNVNADSARDPEARAAERDLIRLWLDREDAQLRDWVARMAGEPQDWQDATAISSAVLLVTVEELAALNRAVADLLDPYRFRCRAGDPPPGARQVKVQLRSFPTD